MQKLYTVLKLTMLFSLTSILLIAKNWQLIGIICLAIIISIIIFQAKKVFLQRIFPLLIIALFTVLFQLIFNVNNNYLARIILGIITATKIISISLLVFLFTTVTSMNSIVELFSFLPYEYKLVLIVTFGIFPIIMQELWSIKIIQNSRGLNTRSWNLYKTFFPLIIPLLHRSFQRAERIAVRIALVKDGATR